MAYDLPLESSWIDSYALIDQERSDDTRGTVMAQLNIVSPGFFRATGVRLEAGRIFSDEDDRRRPGVVIVSESFARLHFPGTAAVGRRLRALTPSRMWTGGEASTAFRIVGVVGDVRNRGLDRAGAPTVYLPLAQFPQFETTVVVRAAGDPLALAPDVRRIVAGLDPALPVGRVDTLEAALDRQVAQPRFALTIVGAFGAAALFLAAIGIYGLLALVVGYRTREIAVRLAIGATPSHVARQVIGQACRLAGTGAVIGLAGALVSGRAIERLLFGVAGTDPIVMTAAPLVLLATALAAAFWPTRRAVARNKCNPRNPWPVLALSVVRGILSRPAQSNIAHGAECHTPVTRLRVRLPGAGWRIRCATS